MLINEQEQLDNYIRLKKKVDDVLERSNKETDLQKAKELLIELQDAFKGLKLKYDHREELWTRVQSAFEMLKLRKANEIENFQREAQANYHFLKKKVDQALQEASRAPDSFSAKEILKETQAHFKGIRMIKEQREELYAKLQAAFEQVNNRIEIQKTSFEKEATLNFMHLQQKVDTKVNEVLALQDLTEAKNNLRDLQAELRELKLTREQRDEIYNKIQAAFDILKNRQDELQVSLEMEMQQNFEYIKPKVDNIISKVFNGSDFAGLRDELRVVQNEIKNMQISRDNRNDLWAEIQKAFDELNARQDFERTNFEKDSLKNYEMLKAKVAEAAKQVQITTEYKQTRNFLISVQHEFKGIKLHKEHREELWTKLQTAFNVLNQRIDEYYRFKRGDWEVRMQTKFSELTTQISDNEKEIEKHGEDLKSLKDQLSILKMRGDNPELVDIVQNKIISAQNHIIHLAQEISKLELEREQVKEKLMSE